MADATDYLLHAALGVLSGGQKAYQRHLDIQESDELARKKIEMEKISPEDLPSDIVQEYGITSPIRKEAIPLMTPSFAYDDDGNLRRVSKFRSKISGTGKQVETPEQKLGRAKELETFKVDIAGKKEQQKLDIKQKEGQPKALKALESYDESIQNTIKNIDEVLNDPKFSRGAGFLGSQESKLKGTPAFNIRAKIESIKAAVGLDQLTELRANSPTGGALGNVSDRDIALLVSSRKNVDPDQSPKELRKALLDTMNIL